jgi:hypothetical protein
MCFVLVACWTVAAAAVKLPAVIGDNMVLQRGQPVYQGWADKVKRSPWPWPNNLTAKAGDDGRWKVCWQTDVDIFSSILRGRFR